METVDFFGVYIKGDRPRKVPFVKSRPREVPLWRDAGVRHSLPRSPLMGWLLRTGADLVPLEQKFLPLRFRNKSTEGRVCTRSSQRRRGYMGFSKRKSRGGGSKPVPGFFLAARLGGNGGFLWYLHKRGSASKSAIRGGKLHCIATPGFDIPSPGARSWGGSCGRAPTSFRSNKSSYRAYPEMNTRKGASAPDLLNDAGVTWGFQNETRAVASLSPCRAFFGRQG